MNKILILVSLFALSSCNYHFRSDLDTDIAGYGLDSHVEQEVSIFKK